MAPGCHRRLSDADTKGSSPRNGRGCRQPSMPEAADRALVSVATAYRYLSSAEDRSRPWTVKSQRRTLSGLLTH